jgi:hypothetical protein
LATDVARVIENLCRFYEFSGKTVVSVGAGGGQLIEYGRTARKVIAVDQDAESLKQLETAVHAKGMPEIFELVHSDFDEFGGRADVVLFEFCLHEMKEPLSALEHARTLAPDIVVLDHWPGSEWAFFVVEEEKVRVSRNAMERFGIRSEERFEAEQRFNDYDELLAKVSVQGPVAIERVSTFRGAANIVIPMVYGVALL